MKMESLSRLFGVVVLLLALLLNFGADAQTPIDSDSRIKTLVFNENEVYSVTARNGFQTSIEFADDEKIDTVTIGDSIGWQIIPAERRVFIKPLHLGGVTNLAVITNRRNYQFELIAADSKDKAKQHAYLIKFFYPEESRVTSPLADRSRGSLRPISNTAIPQLPTPAPVPAAPAPVAAPAIPPVPVASAPAGGSGLNLLNFNYTLTGPDALSPVKIYDDGRSTFFQFRPGVSPKIYSVAPDGSETQVSSRVQGAGMVVVDRVMGRYSVRVGNQVVCVFNEKILSLPQVAGR